MTLNKISKTEIYKLPLKSFTGEIIIVDNTDKLINAITNLKNNNILGFDTETKPSFIKGKNNINKVALLQLSTEKKAYLFRLNKIGLPHELKIILSDKKITKIGLAIKDDIKKLQELNNFEPQNFIDLKNYVKEFEITDAGLKKLTAIVLNFRISKSQQLSNWERDELTDAQAKYAATDSWVCYEIFRKLNMTNKNFVFINK